MRDKHDVINELVNRCLEHDDCLRESLCEIKDYYKINRYSNTLIRCINNALDIIDLCLTEMMYNERENT